METGVSPELSNVGAGVLARAVVPMKQISEITTLVKDSAHEAGFELAGIAPSAAFPNLTTFLTGLQPDTPEK